MTINKLFDSNYTTEIKYLENFGFFKEPISEILKVSFELDESRIKIFTDYIINNFYFANINYSEISQMINTFGLDRNQDLDNQLRQLSNKWAKNIVRLGKLAILNQNVMRLLEDYGYGELQVSSLAGEVISFISCSSKYHTIDEKGVHQYKAEAELITEDPFTKVKKDADLDNLFSAIYFEKAIINYILGKRNYIIFKNMGDVLNYNTTFCNCSVIAGEDKSTVNIGNNCDAYSIFINWLLKANYDFSKFERFEGAIYFQKYDVGNDEIKRGMMTYIRQNYRYSTQKPKIRS